MCYTYPTSLEQHRKIWGDFPHTGKGVWEEHISNCRMVIKLSSNVPKIAESKYLHLLDLRRKGRAWSVQFNLLIDISAVWLLTTVEIEQEEEGGGSVIEQMILLIKLEAEPQWFKTRSMKSEDSKQFCRNRKCPSRVSRLYFPWSLPVPSKHKGRAVSTSVWGDRNSLKREKLRLSWAKLWGCCCTKGRGILG